MATFDEIDVTQGLELVPCQYELQHDSVMVAVRGVEPIRLDALESSLFVEWACTPGWRSVWEMDMQSVSEDASGRALVSSWMWLNGFRRRFCNVADERVGLVALLRGIKERVMQWRDLGVEVVELVGVRDEDKHQAALAARAKDELDAQRLFAQLGAETRP